MERKEKVIISLTTFPAAAKYAVGAIKSVLCGSVLPDRVILYVTLSQFGPQGLPEELLSLEKENAIFEIRNYDTDIRSYRKLVPALKDFPDAVIVTIDDDVYYHRSMLRRLLEMHAEFPKSIIAHRVKRVAFSRPYKYWKKYRWYHFLFRRIHAVPENIQTGVGGVLYPPGSLADDVTDENLFTRLAPTADDIWFWSAAVRNGRVVIPVPFGQNKPKGLGKPRELSLKVVNFKSGKDRNVEALNAVRRHYEF